MFDATLLHKNVFKSGWVVVQEEETRLIDSNRLVAKKIEEQTGAAGGEAPQVNTTGETLEDFEGGIDAARIDALLADPDQTAEPAIDHAGKAQALREQMERELEDARQEAEEIRRRAAREAQDLKQEALAEGRSKGYEDGYNQGIAQIDAMKQELVRKEQDLDRRYENRLEELEPEMVDTLSGIYEHVFHVDLKGYRDILIHLISSALSKIEGSSQFLIHVAREDYQAVCERRDTMLRASVSANADLEVLEDALLAPNECMIETDGGVYDCGLGTELEELARKLKLLSYNKKGM